MFLGILAYTVYGDAYDAKNKGVWNRNCLSADCRRDLCLAQSGRDAGVCIFANACGNAAVLGISDRVEYFVCDHGGKLRGCL